MTEPASDAVEIRTLTLKEKLAEVAADCDYVRKDGVNAYQNYKYASAAAVVWKVGESLYKHRLLSIATFAIVSDVPRSRTNAKGVEVIENLVTVECSLHIHDMDSPDFFTFNGFGSGMDNSDKAVMKAQTAALKYAWMMSLNISTGDDPERDESVDQRAEGKPRPKPEPRGPYKPTSDAGPYIQPPDDPPHEEEPDSDPERPGIFEKPSEPPMTKAQLAAAAGHAVIDKGGTAKDAVVQISRELNESLGQCPCGSPLIEKKTSASKGSKPYKTCQLNDKAFHKDGWAMKRIQELDLSGECPADGHTWKWIR